MPVSETKMQSAKPSKLATILLYLCCIFFFCLFTVLGIWQVKRLHWKLNLIQQVNERVYQPAQAAPVDVATWKKLNFAENEYQHVKLQGSYLNDKEILVTTAQDSTGYWVMTPMQLDNGLIVFINRGFVPMDMASQAKRQAGLITGRTSVTGLLRMGESNGYLFRKNNPKAGIWYSRELAAFADKLGLPENKVAPYFIDADNTPNQGGWPEGGLTAVKFRNSHLSYAITWFLGAALTLVAIGYVSYSNLKRQAGTRK